MRPKEVFKALTSPKYIRDFLRFRALATGKGLPGPALSTIRPITDEATKETGFDTHYTYHTGWAAQVLARSKPAHHVDIGSSLYFVSIGSAVCPITHYDYRPPKLAMPNVSVGAADLLNLAFADRSIPSLSCMHVVEHVGLGRYGDTLDPAGDLRACTELARVLAPGGQLLFVTPVGREAIHFNAHRIYSFEGVLRLFPELRLREFALITDKRDPEGAVFVPNADPARVAKQRYGCGCFVFEKPAEATDA
jgi:SAM-dependent methyltransferase